MTHSRQFPNPQAAEMNGRTFAFEADIADGGVTGRAAGDFLAIHPEAHFAVDRTDVVVVPLTMAFGELLAWETPFAIR